MRLKSILIAVALVALAFAGLKLTSWFAPAADTPAPALVAVPPLPPVQSTSTIVAPVTIALSAIRDAAERATPRTFSGRADNPLPQLLQNADINWTSTRGAIVATGARDTLSLMTPLNGTLNVTGSLSSGARDALGDALGSLLGGNVAKQLGSINIKAMNATADIRGNVGMSARPQLASNWRIDPGLTAQVDLGDTSVSMAGMRLSVPAQVKPVIDRTINEQLAVLQDRIRNDGGLEQAARREWSKMCRSIALPPATPGMPPLWLEMVPVRAIAAQPRIDAANVTLTLGIEANTRITVAQTTPDCPFPATLAIVPRQPGLINIGVPIDMPFTQINALVAAQLVGRTFPEDGKGAVAVTVKKAGIAASGDRLLISVRVDAKEKKSFFGFGGEATVHIYGRPKLDPAQQTLRLTDMTLAVESEAAFGLLGSAARAAMPYLQSAIAERATIDLKPFAADAKKQIAAVIDSLRKNQDGVRIGADITALRLTGIAFDSKTLRVIANADGVAEVAVTSLPGL